MLASRGRTLVFAGLLAAGFSATAAASDTTMQVAAVGEAATEVAALQQSPSGVAQEAYAMETTARPVMTPLPAPKVRTPVRGEVYTSAHRHVAAAPRRSSSCAHLGCRGVHVLGVGY
jgi:hypothetical protein